MSALEVLSLQPWVERLGWTLVHFLWQGLAIAALYAAVRRAVSKPAGPIPARLRGAGSHDGCSTSDVGANAAIGRKAGRRV